MNKVVRLLPFLLITVVYFFAMFIDVMDVDSSQYASMAKEMNDRNSYLEITDQGRNYLDKPPLLFWLSALSYKIFGTNNFAFKLPSLLFALLAIFATYRLAKLYYQEQVAYWAAIILGSTQAFFLMVNDVRTDLMLTGAVIFAVWQIAAYIKNKRVINFILGFTGIGLAMLAKGPIGLVLPAAALGIHLILQRDWKNIFRWQWLAGLIIIGIVLLPMCIGLYNQYDANPDVVVNGQKGVSGLRFYFWTQSFGRITGENVWDNNPGAFFLTESTLWAFAPWTILLIITFFTGWWRVIKQRFKLEKGQEAITIGGFTFALLALSKSSYQLPHYIFVAYPFAAIFTARWALAFLKEANAGVHILKGLQLLIVALIWGAGGALLFYVFAPINMVLPFIILLLFIAVIYYMAKNYANTTSVLQASFISVCAFNLIMNLHFYPNLLQYQAYSVGGKYMAEKIKEHNITQRTFIIFPIGSAHSLDFYTGFNVKNKWTEEYFSHFKNGDTIWVYTNDEGRERLNVLPYDIAEELYLPFFKPTELTIDFLNPKTRQQTIKNHYILRVIIKNQEKADFSPYKPQYD